jgi:hypothetical protein
MNMICWQCRDCGEQWKVDDLKIEDALEHGIIEKVVQIKETI